MTSNKKYDFLIVGAGLFGSVFARQVTDAGYTCLVIDKRNHIAGNAHTPVVNDILVHKYGAHIFHTNDEDIWKYVNRFATFNDYRHKVQVNYKNKLLSFPINLETFEQLYGIQTADEALKHLASVKLKSSKNDFESWAKQRIGEDLYQIFIKGYTEKQWGRPASELPSSIIKRIPIRTTENDDYFDDIYQGIPIGGYTNLVQNMLDGIEIRLGVDYLSQKSDLESLADKVVFTGAIDAYFNYQFGELEYRGLRFEHKTVDQISFQNRAVVNYTDSETPFTRIIEHKKFDNIESKQSVITKEYPLKWEKGEEAYYPINDEKNKKLYKQYQKLSTSEPNMIFGGRLAEYKYYDMHQVIASALSKSEKVINQAK